MPERHAPIFCGCLRGFAIMAMFLASLAAPVPAAASGPDPTGVVGYWLSEKKKVAVKFYPCDEKLCGRIVWLAKPYRRSGEFRRDRKNPDPSLRHRGWCGIEVVQGLKAKSDTRWVKGSFYYPKRGETYDIDLKLKDEDKLELRIYLGIRFLGKSEIWTRPTEEAVQAYACVLTPPEG